MKKVKKQHRTPEKFFKLAKIMVMYGDPMSGFQAYGPFDTLLDAHKWMDGSGPGSEETHILMPIFSPEIGANFYLTYGEHSQHCIVSNLGLYRSLENPSSAELKRYGFEPEKK